MVKSVDAETIALRGLGFLAEDEERLGVFLSVTGLSPQDLRRIAQEPGFLGSILDYICSDEALAKSFAEAEGLTPDILAQARMSLSPQEF